MVPALNKSEIDKKVQERYERDEQRIVGLMMVRYSGNNKAYVDDNYNHWHSITNKNFDIFWPGYGKYGSEKDLILNTDNNDKRVFFDNRSFIEVNNTLKRKIKKFNPNDGGPILILLNYRNGALDYSQALVVNLFRQHNNNPYAIQRTVDTINELVYSNHDINDVYFRAKVKYSNEKNNFSISPIQIYNTGMSTISFILSFFG